MLNKINEVVKGKGSSLQIKTMNVEIVRPNQQNSTIKEFECISSLNPNLKRYTLLPFVKRHSNASYGVLLKKYWRLPLKSWVIEFPNIEVQLSKNENDGDLVYKKICEEVGGVGLSNFEIVDTKFDVYKDPWKSDIQEKFMQSIDDDRSLNIQEFLDQNQDMLYFDLGDANCQNNLKRLVPDNSNSMDVQGLEESQVKLSAKVWHFVLGIYLHKQQNPKIS